MKPRRTYRLIEQLLVRTYWAENGTVARLTESDVRDAIATVDGNVRTPEPVASDTTLPPNVIRFPGDES
jgi:hypothetical protein